MSFPRSLGPVFCFKSRFRFLADPSCGQTRPWLPRLGANCKSSAVDQQNKFVSIFTLLAFTSFWNFWWKSRVFSFWDVRRDSNSLCPNKHIRPTSTARSSGSAWSSSSASLQTPAELEDWPGYGVTEDLAGGPGRVGIPRSRSRPLSSIVFPNGDWRFFCYDWIIQNIIPRK